MHTYIQYLQFGERTPNQTCPSNCGGKSMTPGVPCTPLSTASLGLNPVEIEQECFSHIHSCREWRIWPLPELQYLQTIKGRGATAVLTSLEDYMDGWCWIEIVQRDLDDG